MNHCKLNKASWVNTHQPKYILQTQIEKNYPNQILCLNLRKMNFTYQVINCTNVGNFRIFSMLKGFQTGKGGEGGCQVFQGG